MDTARAIIKAKPGSHLNDEQAAQVYEAALLLPEHERTAEALIAVAETGHPIQELFEWDDGKAAHEYRLVQARHALRSVCFEVEVNEQTEYLPVFFAVHTNGASNVARSYVVRETLTDEERLKERVLAQAKRDFLAFQSRYGKYRDLLESESPFLAALLDAKLS